MTPARPAMRAPAPVARWLAGKTRSERRTLTALMIVAVVALLWAAIWQPLVRDTDAMRAARGGDAAALAVARKMSEEAVGLARTSVTPAPADARAGLERILVQQNLRSANHRLKIGQRTCIQS